MPALSEWELSEKRGGGHNPKSKRIGLHLGRRTRTFHAHFSSIVARTGGAEFTLDYATREGQFDDRDDLEHVAGDRRQVEVDSERIEATARLSGRPERIVVKLISELPIESTPESRRATADAIVEYWRRRGHSAIAAVHSSGDRGQPQPHMHIVIASRPVDSMGTVDRTSRLMVGRAAVRAEREALARIINQHAAEAVKFFAGRDRDMEVPGIQGRTPTRRLPERQWHLHGQRQRDEAAVAQAKQKAEEVRKAADAERQARQQQRAAKQASNAAAEREAAMQRDRAERAERREAENRKARKKAEADLESLRLSRGGKPTLPPTTLDGALAGVRADLAARQVAPDLRPASFKQLAFAIDLATKKGLSVFENDDQVASAGEIGILIRRLQGMPDAPAALSADELKRQLDEKTRLLATTEALANKLMDQAERREAELLAPREKQYPRMPALAADGGDRGEVAAARRTAEAYTPDELIGAILATRHARDARAGSDTVVGRNDYKELIVGLEIGLRVAAERGIEVPPSATPTGRSGRGHQNEPER